MSTSLPKSYLARILREPVTRGESNRLLGLDPKRGPIRILLNYARRNGLDIIRIFKGEKGVAAHQLVKAKSGFGGRIVDG